MGNVVGAKQTKLWIQRVYSIVVETHVNLSYKRQYMEGCENYCTMIEVQRKFFGNIKV